MNIRYRYFILLSFYSVLAIFAQPLSASWMPVWQGHLKFEDFLTDAEKTECNELGNSKLFTKYKLNVAYCKDAYAEYKIARQLSNKDHEEAIRKLNPNHELYRNIIWRRHKLHENEFSLDARTDKLYIHIVENKMLKNANVREVYQLHGAFKRMFEGK